jgi:acetoin utilization deacetylase AcuC-like enzyme
MSVSYNELIEQLESLAVGEVPNKASRARVAYVYDEEMTRHCGDNMHPERPDRIRTINDHLKSEGLLEEVEQVPARLATRAEVMLAHSEEMVESVFGIEENPNLIGGPELDTDVLVKQKQNIFPFDSDTYVCHSSTRAARLACGSVLSIIDRVCDPVANCPRGFAAIRPPGHHAGFFKSRGFCLFNNVAVAANYAREKHSLDRVLIIDFDVHHGNGTCDIFHESNKVLFISIHRYDKGKFYPSSGHLDDIGSEAGLGYNINVPIDGSYGDEEMWYSWEHVVIPAIEAFKPELILVSAGFDAAENDPLGKCHVKCCTYGKLVDKLIETIESENLRSITKGRLVLVLEGGYNLVSIASASVSCMKSLLGISTLSPASTISSPSTSSVSSIRSVPSGVPKSSLVRVVHQLTNLLSSVDRGLKLPISPPVIPAKRTGADVEAQGSFLLHSGGGHPGAVVRYDEEHVIKRTTVREALCYLLIGEALGYWIEIESKTVNVSDLLKEEKERISFDKVRESFIHLGQFVCRCKRVMVVSSTDAFVVITDLTHGLAVDDSLGVLDIKLGTEYHTPEDLPDRVVTRRQKAENTSASSLGIRITAVKCLDGFSVKKQRAAKLKLIEQMVPLVRRFMYSHIDDFESSIETATTFIDDLYDAFDSRRIDVRFIASSLLFVIGRDAHSGLVHLRCKIIDLAHMFPNGKLDVGIMIGLSSMKQLFEDVKQPSYESA